MSEEKTLKLDVPIAEKFVQPMADTFKVLGDPTLRHAGLVKFTKTGKEVFYSLDDQHVLTLFAQALDHIKHRV